MSPHVLNRKYINLPKMALIPSKWSKCLSSSSDRLYEYHVTWCPHHGGVIRDHLGKMIRIYAGSIKYEDSTKAEVMGLNTGLREFKKIGVG